MSNWDIKHSPRTMKISPQRQNSQQLQQPPQPHQQLQLYQPKPTTDEFPALFIFVVKCFRQFGLASIRVSYSRGKPKFELSRALIGVTVLILVAQWAALIASFTMDTKTHMITGIANHIQFITNVLAATAALAVPMIKCHELNEIMEQFCLIDDELNQFDVVMPYAKLRKNFLRIYLGQLLFLIVSCVYDGYVSLILSQSSHIWMWFFKLLPFIVYSLAFLNAFVMIMWVKIRIQQLNSLIEQYHHHPPTPMITEKRISIVTLNVESADLSRTPKSPGLEQSVNDRILLIVSKTIDVASRLESYYGLLFLFGYMALFSVTTIQVYYCHLHVIASKDNKQGFSGFTFSISALIIATNLVAILAIPYICEQVGSESKTLMSYLSKLSMRYGHNMHSAVWFPNMISSIKFSALGFFNINYNMLSGFFAGLITYLIIFIQFNSIVPATDATSHQARSGSDHRTVPNINRMYGGSE